MRIVQKVLDQIWPGWQVECILGQGPYGTVYRISRTDEPGSRYQDPSDLRKDLEKVRIAGSEIERKPDTAVDRPSDPRPEPVSEPGSKMNGRPVR